MRLVSRIVLGSAIVALTLGLAASIGAAGFGSKAKVVGHVVAIGGTRNLETADAAGGPLRKLRANEALTLGEVVVMGAGVTAILSVTRPAGVSTAVDLIDLELIAE